MTTNSVQAASLIYTEGSSDKEYNCQIVAVNDGYMVNFQYGRRGNSLTSGSKTAQPVSLESAEKIFKKLVTEKSGKGYRHAEAANDATSYTSSGPAESFQSPQLLNDITEEEALQLICDDRYEMQPKKDGKRILLDFSESGLKVSNKRAKACSVPTDVSDQTKRLQRESEFGFVSDVALDGELVGTKYFVFDILRLDQINLKSAPFNLRRRCYTKLLEFSSRQIGSQHASTLHLIPVETFVTTQEKRQAFETIKASNGEGVVFKLRDAPYTDGRPNSGGPVLKFKFRESSSAVCLGQGKLDKRSIRLGMFDENGELVDVGNVTVPVNHSIPEHGEVVEVLYLYKYVGGSLFQPVFKGVRDDVVQEECKLSQVKRLKDKVSEAGED